MLVSLPWVLPWSQSANAEATSSQRPPLPIKLWDFFSPFARNDSVPFLTLHGVKAVGCLCNKRRYIRYQTHLFWAPSALPFNWGVQGKANRGFLFCVCGVAKPLRNVCWQCDTFQTDIMFKDARWAFGGHRGDQRQEMSSGTDLFLLPPGC